MNKKANILLIGEGSSDSIGRALCGTLEHLFNLDVKLELESFSAFQNDRIIKLSGERSLFNIDLMLFCVDENNYARTKDLLYSIRKAHEELPVILMIKHCQPRDLVSLLKCGATDFIVQPFNEVEISSRIARILEHSIKCKSSMFMLRETVGLRQLVGEHLVFTNEIRKIPVLAKYDTNVLITGETGTGKDLCARAIHYLSSRSSMPFIPVNCGALPHDLVENELFGHSKGAFTGADKSRAGLVREAIGGTLFLDEIDSLPLSSQVKILRFLQEKEYRQVGSPKTNHADVRIITATNADLERAINEGSFRKDLFYRLKIVSMNLPPLREHKEDISLLVDHFLSRYALEHNKQVTGIESGALRKLLMYDWPGNVRELENTVERAVIFTGRTIIESRDIDLPIPDKAKDNESFNILKSRVIAEFEKTYIKSLLLSNNGNITKAANEAQKNRRAFWELIRKHNIDAESFKET